METKIKTPLDIILLDMDAYLARFKVHTPVTLFPPNFENLQKNLCPICSRKLYITANKKMAYCKSKVKDKFIISVPRLLALGGKI